jgi:carbonic anhydrase
VSAIDELLHNADSYGESFSGGDVPMPPAMRVAVVACMDARLNPTGLLGLREAMHTSFETPAA